MKRTVIFKISAEQDGVIIKNYLRSIGVSTTQMRSMKQYGGIFVNGKSARVVDKLKTNDELRLEMCDENEQSNNVEPSNAPIKIVFENEDVLVVDKPSGMPTHPSFGHHNDSLANAVVGYYNKKGETFVFRAVTRLDSETSGLCVIAKNAFTHEFLQKRLHTDEFVREYVALVEGEITKSGQICEPIKRESHSTYKRIVHKDGVYAKTDYTPIKHQNGKTLLKLRLYTGRTHQIRVHTSYIGHPIIGDKLYSNCEYNRLCLHSYHINMKLPFTNETIDLISEPDFKI